MVGKLHQTKEIKSILKINIELLIIYTITIPRGRGYRGFPLEGGVLGAVPLILLLCEIPSKQFRSNIRLLHSL